MFANNDYNQDDLLDDPSEPGSSGINKKRRRREDTTFQCPQCSRIFGRIEHLRRHATSHGEARSFKCLACGKGFNRLDTLQRHELIHQKDPGVSKLKGARACRECASSKVRCNGAMPCERCGSKNTDCVYPSAASPAQALDSPSSVVSDVVSTPGAASDTASSSLLESASLTRQLEQSLPHVNYAAPYPEHSFGLSDAWQYPINTESATQSSNLVQAAYPSFVPAITSHDANIQQQAFSPFDGSYSGTEASFDLRYSSPVPRDRHASLDQLSRRPRLVPSLRSKTAILDSDSPRLRSMTVNSQVTTPYAQSDLGGTFSRSFAPSTTYLNRRPRFNFPLSGKILPTFQSDAYQEFDILSEQSYFAIHRSFLAICTGLTAFQPPYGSTNFPSRQTLNAFIKLYLERFHPLMPIVHYPTLNLDESHWILSLAIIAIGSHMADYEQSEEYCLCLDELLRRSIAALDPQEGIDRTTLCQAKLLACINQLYSGDEAWQDSAYKDYMPDLLTFCRVDWKKLEIRFPTVLPPEHAFEYWKQWIEVEGRRRTGYAIWMLDTMWAYQFQVQPKLTLEDGKVQLPCQEVLWEAKTASQWHHVFQYSPANITLVSAMQSLQEEKILQHTMGEFSRIILVHGFFQQNWETERTQKIQFHLRHTPEYTHWKNTVSEWLEILHWNANNVVNAASGMEHPTILYLHLARIVLFSPFQRICDLAYAMTKEDTSITAQQMSELRATIHRWIAEDEQKARLATLHAGALFRHLQHFHTGGFYEPSAVLLATLTLWAYSAFTNVAPQQSLISQRRYSETQGPGLEIMLDGPINSELASMFVGEGRDMTPCLTSLGSIRGIGKPEKVLLEGSKLVADIGRWGSGRKVMRILNNLSLCRSI